MVQLLNSVVKKLAAILFVLMRKQCVFVTVAKSVNFLCTFVTFYAQVVVNVTIFALPSGIFFLTN
jgi:hypothetical protein